MFWADKITSEIKQKCAKKIQSGAPLVIRDEKTASGRVHVGSLRGVAIHGIIAEILGGENISNKYFFEINDFDPMDGLPVYLDREKFLPFMGMSLCNVPSPDGKAENYAEYFAEEFVGVIAETGFVPEYYRSSDVYKSGRYNEVIKIALENDAKIREIYQKISGSVKVESWLPIQMICEKCGKVGTTRSISFDGENVEYACEENMVSWAKGCGYAGKNSPYGGNAKLPWKVEWAAKFKIFGVDIEGAGKDHSTRGGSREIADAIAREVFGQTPPYNIPYEFLHVGGRKMSSSKGAGSSSREIADALPHELLRLLLLFKDPKRVIDFMPDGDTIPILFDTYDKLAEAYFQKAPGDYPRIFALMHSPKEREKIEARFLPRFSQIAFLAQMPHMDIEAEVKKIKEAPLTDADKREIDYRAKYAKNWLKNYAAEDFKYELKEKEIPDAAKNLSGEQKAALKILLEYVSGREKLDGQELHTKLHDIKKETDISPQALFSAIYLIFLSKESGPKAGWFLQVLDRKFLEKRLSEAVK